MNWRRLRSSAQLRFAELRNELPRDSHRALSAVADLIGSGSNVTVEGTPLYAGEPWGQTHEFGMNALLPVAQTLFRQRGCSVTHHAMVDDFTTGVLEDISRFAIQMRYPPDTVVYESSFTRQLTQANNNDSDWADVAKDSFEFALLANQRFENGDSEDKKVIFKAIGLNPILLDQKLEYQPRFIFLKLKEGAKMSNDKSGPLEPKNSPSNRDNLKSYLKSSLWCLYIILLELILSKISKVCLHSPRKGVKGEMNWRRLGFSAQLRFAELRKQKPYSDLPLTPMFIGVR